MEIRIGAIIAGFVCVLGTSGCMWFSSNMKVPSVVDSDDAVRVRMRVAKEATSPLVVDWEPENRAELEVQSKTSPAIVAFDDKQFRLLHNCRAPGKYYFVGVSPKKQFITMRSHAELHANVPASAFTLGARLGKHDWFRADLWMIGRRVLDRPIIKHQALRGQCKGATHIVRSLTIGAFRFHGSTKTTAGAKAGREIFGGGLSKSKGREVLQEDGEFSACDLADPNSDKPPPKCSGILRISLTPLGKSNVTVNSKPVCGYGLRWNGDGCVSETELKRQAKKSATVTNIEDVVHRITYNGYVCTEGNAAECEKQCRLGNLSSCVNYGFMLLEGKVVKQNIELAQKLFDFTCDRSNSRGCYLSAFMLSQKGKEKKAVERNTRGCNLGDQDACLELGIALAYGRGISKNRIRATRLFARSCKMQNWQACNNAGALIFAGNTPGLPHDLSLAANLFERACRATKTSGCPNLGEVTEFGMGIAKNINKAYNLYLDSCNKNMPEGCYWAGLLLERSGQGSIKVRAQQALTLYEKACSMHNKGGCWEKEELRKVYPSWTEDDYDRRACDGGYLHTPGCYNAAIVLERGLTGTRNPQRAAFFLNKACKGKMQKACRNPR